MSASRIRVLVVEDSPVVRQLMTHVFESETGFELVGTATDGDEALAAVRRLRPDVVTMDVHMARMDGLEATRGIMQEAPLPIVIVSGTVDDQVAATFDALEAGALAFLRRPAGIGGAQHNRDVAELVRTVRLMSEVKVVRRRFAKARGAQAVDPRQSPLRMVAIGASTGGPVAIQALLQALPKDFPVPILIVQHISEGFLGGFVDWLNRTAAAQVHLGADGGVPLPGHAYVAPDGRHMGIDGLGKLRLSDAPPDHGLRPSVAHLLRAVRAVYGGSAAAVLLSGMGRDGAEELLELRRCGAQTFVQDRASSVVYGMPGVALKLDAARHVMPPEEIGAMLASIAQRGNNHGQ